MEEFGNLESTRFISQISLANLSRPCNSQPFKHPASNLSIGQPCKLTEIDVNQVSSKSWKQAKRLRDNLEKRILDKRPMLSRSLKISKQQLKKKFDPKSRVKPKSPEPEHNDNLLDYSLVFLDKTLEHYNMSIEKSRPQQEIMESPSKKPSTFHFGDLLTKTESKFKRLNNNLTPNFSRQPTFSRDKHNNNADNKFPPNSNKLNNGALGLSNRTSTPYKNRLFSIISGIASQPIPPKQSNASVVATPRKPEMCRTNFLEEMCPKEVAKSDAVKNKGDGFYCDRELSLRYVVQDILGKGSFACVRLGSNRQTNQRVAIKIYSNLKGSSPSRFDIIRNEIKVLKRLNHAGINKLYDVVVSHDQINIVLELVEGQNLNTYLSRKPHRRISEDRAHRIFCQIVEIIDYCHSENVFHRDIKLSNVMINKHNKMFLIDFGFALTADKDHLIKNYCGTLNYMAPELVLGRPHRGGPVDVWALGVLLYKAVVGDYPFKGELTRKLRRGDQKEHRRPQLRSAQRTVPGFDEAVGSNFCARAKSPDHD